MSLGCFKRCKPGDEIHCNNLLIIVDSSYIDKRHRYYPHLGIGYLNCRYVNSKSIWPFLADDFLSYVGRVKILKKSIVTK